MRPPTTASRTTRKRSSRRWPPRGKQPNLSFFAFTATPKYKTLEVFGRPGADGKPVPFHLYSMRQAIEEGFILDVLANYTTYKTYYRPDQGRRGRPRGREEAGRQGARPLHEPAPLQHRPEDRGDGRALPRRTRATRSAAGPRRWWSRARACTPCATSRRSTRYLADKGYTDIKTLVAFSGEVDRPRRARPRPTPRSA